MTLAEPIHLKPAADLADRVLLPGDPHRALAIAQSLLEGPRMFNHHRGLWGYTGIGPDGLPVTVQATGMGGPSAAIVIEELLTLGARTLIRVGTCGALVPDLGLGDLVVAVDALAADGASAALGASERVGADPRITACLDEAARARGRTHAGTVVSTDLFYGAPEDAVETWRSKGALAAEMEAATIFRLGELRGAASGCVLAVSDLPAGGDDGPRRIDREGIEAAGIRLGDVAMDALLALSPAAGG